LFSFIESYCYLEETARANQPSPVLFQIAGVISMLSGIREFRLENKECLTVFSYWRLHLRVRQTLEPHSLASSRCSK